MKKVYIDFETKSAAPLKDCGAAIYSEDPTTDVLCVGVNIDDVPWITATEDLTNKTRLTYIIDLIQNSDAIFVAHNASFEQWIWANVMVKKYGYPEIPTERWRCTMAKAYAHGLPGSLKDIAKVLNLPVQKDMEGRDNMLSLSKPIPEKKVTYTNAKKLAKKYALNLSDVKPKNWDDHKDRQDILDLFKIVDFWTPQEQPEKFQKLYEYCITDVEVCKLIDETLPDLSPIEQETWVLDQEMNKTGILIDRLLVTKITSLIDQQDIHLLKEFTKVTGIESPRQRTKLLEWLSQNGINLKDTQKSTISSIKTDSPEVLRMIEIAKDLSKSSVAKFYKMIETSTAEGRVREIDQYHAAHTGRYGGRGFQIQNLPRIKPTIELDDIRYKSYEELKPTYPDLMASASTVLRQMIIPSPEHKFLIGDFAQMEARVLAWLAGEQWVLDAFKAGQDLYCIEASNIFGYAVTKAMTTERQIGKVAILALGYGGGIGAFGNMAKGYGCDLHPVAKAIWDSATDEEQANSILAYGRYSTMVPEPIDETEGVTADIIKQRWRKANPNIVQFWKNLEKAVKAALTKSNPLSIWQLNGNFLNCRLPSGRIMVYPFPAIESDGKLSYYSHNARTTNFREYTYGGKLSENITQAVQRDLLRDALLNMAERFTPALFSVHDEIVCESKTPETDLEIFKNIMKEVPAWATGIPIDVDAKIAERYEK